MQQVCNNFLADPTDTSFGFQIKCKNCQFTRKQHIQNTNAKPIPQTTSDNTTSANTKQLVNVVENAFQNPKNQVGMYGSLHQKKDIATTKTNEQGDFKKTTSLNQQQSQKDESDPQLNNSIKMERQNLQIYNSDKASTNSNPQDQEKINNANESNKDQNSNVQALNPSVQEDSNSSQKQEQIQNQNETKPSEPQEQKPNKLQSNPFIQQNQNSPQKLESKSNISQPFQIKPQVQLIKDQKEQQQTINQSQNQSQGQDEQITNPQPQNEQIVKPQTQNEQPVKPKTENEQPIKPQTQNEQKPQGNLQIPQANQNTNQPQSVKERAKGMQVFGFGAPPPMKIAQKSDQEKPFEQYIIDRPILQNKKHIRTQQDFQAIQK
ncbi:unnamed protein product (macronuclear) [Paramecium tetraurelia]|uniref:Uncharacterized protein n=1 Tax=Paramecium tetraurelia TaxID=5888 RepID=A0BU55_PARTE|nr:uncharacterized protein GSPATT00032304001 [Paramecium tetraurelia]CAK62072.1 unnamed protein product [Paramecium tetraurelia]|eukprot:XP_001429470.1 hypothetical protein (macronuclear) [Paramecium tetraurelia strain d4-2]